jgi:serine/threonine-protein kinase
LDTHPSRFTTDIWAFGCLLYEMLSGHRPFAGETVTDTLATVIQTEPDWGALPSSTPLAVSQLVKRCLEKDAKRRLQAIGEARLLLEELTQVSASGRLVALDLQASPQPQAARPGSRPPRLAALAVAALGGALLGGVFGGAFGGFLRPVPAKPPTWLSMSLTPAAQLGDQRPRFSAFALSPDGRKLAFAGVVSGKTSLYLRSFDRPEAAIVAGTEDAAGPFFSPDGRWIGFVQGSVIKRVSVEGGPVTTIADFASRGGSSAGAPSGGDVYGASWGEGDRVVAGRYADGLFEVTAAGGAPRRLTVVEGKPDTFAHRLPQVLPGGRAVLFTLTRNLAGDSDVAVLTPSGEERVLVESAADGRYLPSGHLVFFREGVLHAAAFDLGQLALKGLASPILDDVLQATGSGAPARNSGAAQFSWSGSGTLVFAAGGAQPLSTSAPVWIDRRGRTEPLGLRDGYYARPRLSPDGRRIAMTHTTEGRRDRTRIWVLDLARGAFSPLAGQGYSGPVWSADGERLFFRGSKPTGLYQARADGAGEPELLLAAPGNPQAGSTSPDGALLTYVDRTPETNLDIWVLPLAGDKKPRPWLKTSANENHPELSPDGRWMAYVSNVSGRNEVYVQAFPGPEGSRYQISLAGGQSARWSPEGRELFFVTDARPRRLMVVDIRTVPEFGAGKPREIFAAGLDLPGGSTGYDPSPDGQRFLVLQDKETPDRSVENLNVILDGFGLFAPAVPR